MVNLYAFTLATKRSCERQLNAFDRSCLEMAFYYQ